MCVCKCAKIYSTQKKIKIDIINHIMYIFNTTTERQHTLTLETLQKAQNWDRKQTICFAPHIRR